MNIKCGICQKSQLLILNAPYSEYRILNLEHQIIEEMNFREGASLVGQLFPHPVGVFCTLLGPPNCHIVQNHILLWMFDISDYFSYSSL